jgi:hypothetical protein
MIMYLYQLVYEQFQRVIAISVVLLRNNNITKSKFNENFGMPGYVFVNFLFKLSYLFLKNSTLVVLSKLLRAFKTFQNFQVF